LRDSAAAFVSLIVNSDVVMSRWLLAAHGASSPRTGSARDQREQAAPQESKAPKHRAAERRQPPLEFRWVRLPPDPATRISSVGQHAHGRVPALRRI